MAPPTRERAALEVNCDSYSWSVVKSIPFNVKDSAKFLFHAEISLPAKSTADYLRQLKSGNAMFVVYFSVSLPAER